MLELVQDARVHPPGVNTLELDLRMSLLLPASVVIDNRGSSYYMGAHPPFGCGV